MNYDHQLCEKFYDTAQHHDVIGNSELCNLYPEENDHSMIDQEPTNYPSNVEIQVHPEIIIQYNPDDKQQDVMIDSNLQPDGVEIDFVRVTRAKKTKRSAAAQKRRNQKSSLRHRKNRYHFEIIRPVDTNIATIKQILRRRAVPYLNVNIVRSTPYIDLQSQAFQDYYEQLLPMDLFL